MGGFSSYCQICGVSMNQDGLIPIGDNMYKIYRGEEEAERPYPFVAREHDWLKKGVAVPLDDSGTILMGTVCDGDLTASNNDIVDVEDGLGDSAIVHEACWKLAGCGKFSTFEHVAKSGAWRDIEQKLHHQWFLWDQVDPSFLLDPSISEANRNRILSLLQLLPQGATTQQKNSASLTFEEEISTAES